MTLLLSDRQIGLAILNKMSFDVPFIKLQFIGLTQDTADETDKEWLALTLLNTLPIKSRRNYRMRRGLFQASSFSRFSDKAVDNKFDRPWDIADQVLGSLSQARVPINDGDGNTVGTMVFDEGSSVYLPEDDLIKPKLGRNLEPGSVHAVVTQFDFVASLC